MGLEPSSIFRTKTRTGVKVGVYGGGQGFEELGSSSSSLKTKILIPVWFLFFEKTENLVPVPKSDPHPILFLLIRTGTKTNVSS